jgi:hypothetical protein
MVNSTVAKNTATPGTGSGGAANATGAGGIVTDSSIAAQPVILYNNTITQNTTPGSGGGLYIDGAFHNIDPTLLNNVIQGNKANGSPSDLDSGTGTSTPLTNATNNFITATSPGNAVNPATNTVGNSTAQLGTAVGVTGSGNPTGGPIYYPLLPNVVSVGAGTTSVLSTIASVEGTTTNLVTDEVGQLMDGVSLGAVQPLALEPSPTAIVPGNASVNYYAAGSSPAFTITAAVNATLGGTASGGAVSIYLSSDNNPPTLLGSAIVGANGIATVSVPAGALPLLQPGSYQLIENYSGNASFDASNAAGTLTIISDPTSVVGGNATLNYFGATSPAFTVTAAVNSPEGTVNGGTVNLSLVAGGVTTAIGSATVANGAATISVAAAALPADLQAGSYQLIETYAGNSPFAGSSGSGTLTITAAPTSVVAANATLNYFGSTASPAFSLTAGVNSPVGTVNTGSVTVSLVSDNTTTTLGTFGVLGGTATISVAAGTLPADLQVGSYQLIETYTALVGGQFAGSSASGTLIITNAPTTVVPGNATLNYYGSGASPAFTVTVGINSPAGTVNTGSVAVSLASDNTTTSLGSAALTASGTATVSVAAGTLPANLQVGNYQLIETYTGVAGGQFTGSSGSGTLAITTDTTSLVSGSATVNYYGSTASPAFIIPVAVNSPQGPASGGTVSITLVSGSTKTSLGVPAAVTAGTSYFSVAAGTLPAGLQTGSYSLIETYSGFGQYAGSTGSGTLTVATASTSVAPGDATLDYYGSTPSPAFSLAVGVNSPAGTVTTGSVAVSLVSDNTTTSLGTAALTANGTATISVAANTLPASLAAGSYQLIETYTDAVGGQFAGSSGTGTLTITTASTTVVPANATLDYYDGNPSPSFVLTVGVNSPEGTVNSGTVSFTLVSGSTKTVLGTSSTVAGGTAFLTVAANKLPPLQTGSYQLLEAYSGSGPFASSSATGTLTITTASTTVAPGNAAISYYGSTASPAFSLVVGVNSPEGTVTTGSVAVSLVLDSTTTSLGTGTMTSNGTATISVAAGTLPANLQPGSYQLIETYTDAVGGQFGGSSGTGTLTITTDSSSLVAGNAVVNFYGSSSSPAFIIPVAVNSPEGTVNGGTVSITLVSGNTKTSLGTTAAVADGTAYLSVAAGTLPANLQTGNYELVETYAGSGQFAGSSSTGTLTITTAPTTIVPGDATVNFYGGSPSPAVTITAGVNSPAGTVITGSVSFSLVSDNITTFLGSGTLSVSGAASISVPANGLPAGLQVGTYQLIETYTDVAGGQFAGSNGSGTLTITTDPTTVVPGNANVNFFGSSASPAFIIPVAVNSPEGTVNGGTVSITLVSGNTRTSLGTTAAVAGGAAYLSVAAGTLPANLQPGGYQLIETYTAAAGGQFAGSSGSGTLTITSAATTVVPGNATLNYFGSTASPAFTLMVGVNSPAGTVNTGSIAVSLVSDNTTTSLGTAALTVDGTATLSVAAGLLPALQVGSYQLIETYTAAADSPFAGSSGSGTLTITTSPTTLVAGNAKLGYYDSTPSPAFTLMVGVNSPAGTVNTGSVSISLVSDNTTTVLGSGALSANGTVTVSVAANALPANLQVGSYQLIETYTDVAGGLFAGSSGSGTLMITSASTSVVPGSATLNYYDSSASPAFALTVAVNSPAGTVNTGSVSVSLISGSTTTPLGTAALSANGTATLNVSAGALPANLQVGSYQLIETYTDVASGQFGGSSGSGTLTITTVPTTVAAGNATLNYFDNSPSPAFVLTVGVNSPAGTVNTGSVSVGLISGNTTTALGTAAVSADGKATISVPAHVLPANLQVGSYQLIETYTDIASGQFAGSTANGTLTISTVSTSVAPGNGIITIGSTGSITIPVAVNSSVGVVSGNVTLALVQGNTSMLLTPATGVPLSGGTVSVSVAVPSGLPIGTYLLVETYLGNGEFAGSSAMGTLTVNPVPVPVAALGVAIDAAALSLLLDPNLGALMELQMFSEVFLHMPVPTSVPALIEAIQFLYPQTGGLGLAAIGAGMFLAQDLQIENSTSD